MTEHTFSAVRRAGLRAFCLALAGAAPTVPTLPAFAAEAAPNARDVPASPATRPVLGPETTVRQPAGPPAGRGPSAPAGGAPVAGPDAAELAGKVYGPPEPKLRKGNLPEVAWPEAPAVIPPALDDAVRIVTRNYPSATAARSDLRAAASDVRAAKWQRFPSLSANVGYFDTAADGAGNLSPTLLVSAPIWSAGRIPAGIRRAKAGEVSSSANYVLTVKTLAEETAQTYFQIASLTLREQLLAESLKEHARLVETMERRVEQEVSPTADLELARSRASQIEQQYALTQAQRQAQLRRMAELVADPNYDLGPVPYYDPSVTIPNAALLEEQAVAYDPELRRLRSDADVARAEVDEVRASIFPQVEAQYNYDDVRGSRFGVGLRAQTTGGLSQFSRVNSGRQRVRAALDRARALEEDLRRRVATDLIQYESSKRQASISLGAATTASRVSESYMRQFIAGRRSWLDVMNALREAVNAQITRSESEIGVMSAAARLMLESGRWRPEFPGQLQSQEN